MQNLVYISRLIEQLNTLSPEKNEEIRLGCRLILNTPEPVPASVRAIILKWVRRLATYTLETQSLLAEVFASQREWESFPDWQGAGLAPSVQLKWLAAQLNFEPEDALGFADPFFLRQALLSSRPVSKYSWERLLSHVVDHPAPMVRNCLIPLLEKGLKAAALSFDRFREWVRAALGEEDLELVEGGCWILRENRYLFPQCPEKELRLLMRKGGGYELLGVKTLALWAPHPLMEEILEGDSWTLGAKLEALHAISQEPSPASLSQVIQFLQQFPEHALSLGHLLERHSEKQIYPRKAQLTELFTRHLESNDLNGYTFARLISPANEAAILEYPRPVDPISLLKWIFFWRDFPHPIAEERLKELLEPESVLPDCLSQLLEALIHRNVTTAEPLLLQNFDNAPKVYLEALKLLGGNKTVEFLKARLSFADPLPTNVPEYEREALEVLFSLSHDQEGLWEYLERRKVPDRGGFLKYYWPKRSAQAVQLALVALKDAEVEEAKKLLANIEEWGDFDTLSALIPWLAHEEETLAQRAGEVCISIANRAHAEGDFYPRSLLRVSPNSAYRRVLTEKVLLAVMKEDRSEKRQRYLGFLKEVLHGAGFGKYLPELLAHRDPHVVKFVLACLGSVPGDEIRGYFHTYLHLDQDIYTLRQALIGAKATGNRSLEPLVIPLLNHRNMNIKKTAAEYLAQYGSELAVPELLRWLGNHDNPGFRAPLQGGLRRILGGKWEFVLLNTLEDSERPGKRDNLISPLLETCGARLPMDIDLDFPGLKASDYFLDWQQKVRKAAYEEEGLLNWVNEWRHQQAALGKVMEKDEKRGKGLLKWSFFEKETCPEVLHDSIPAILRSFLVTYPADREFIGKRLATWNAVVTAEEARWVMVATEHWETQAWAIQTLFLDPEAPEKDIDHIEKLEGNPPRTHVWVWRILHQSRSEALDFACESWLNMWRTKCAWELENWSTAGLAEALMDRYSGLEKGKPEDRENLLMLTMRWIIELRPPSLMDFVRKYWPSESFNAQLDLLNRLSPDQRNALEAELIAAYPHFSKAQRETLLYDLRKTSGLNGLRRLAFEDYPEYQNRLFRGAVPKWALQHWQREMIMADPRAFDVLGSGLVDLNGFPDSFLTTYLTHLEQKEQTEGNAIYVWPKVPVVRMWKLIEPLLKAGKWAFLNMIVSNRPVNAQLFELLKAADLKGKILILEWLRSLPVPLYFPGLEEELMGFIRGWEDPELPYRVLFRLDVWAEGHPAGFVQRFLDHFRDASGAQRAIIIRLLNADPDHPLVAVSAFRKMIVQGVDREGADLIALLLNTTHWHNSKDARYHLPLLIRLGKEQPEAALSLLEGILEKLSENPLPDQLDLLEILYPHAFFQSQITAFLTQLLLRESMLMSFLSPEMRDRFQKSVCQEIRLNQLPFELEIKTVLRRLSESPFPELIELLKYLLLESRIKKYKHAALRFLRNVLTQEEFLEVCVRVLDSPLPDLVRAAVRSLSFAGYKEVIPALIDLLTHRQKALRESAEAGLIRFGKEALPGLKKALSRARPDRRKRLKEVIAKIEG